MTLQDLKTQLQIVTDTEIGDVFFDWQKYLNEARSKAYPAILWMLDGSKFTSDLRASTIQQQKPFTLVVFAIAHFNNDTQDKLTVWDTLEDQFKDYINLVNGNNSLSVENIDKVKGQYAGEGLLSADREIGIKYEIELKLWC